MKDKPEDVVLARLGRMRSVDRRRKQIYDVKHRKRDPYGSQGHAHLTAKDRAEIRARYKPGVIGLKTLAEEYRVSFQHIGRVINGYPEAFRLDKPDCPKCSAKALAAFPNITNCGKCLKTLNV